MPRSLPVAGAPLAAPPPAVLVAELQDPLHRGRDGGPLAAGEAAEAADDRVGVLVLEVSGDAGELPSAPWRSQSSIGGSASARFARSCSLVVSHLSETLGLTPDRNTPSMV